MSNLEMAGAHPDIRWQFQPNRTSASAPAPASGYPLAAAGILGYPPSMGRLEGLPSSRPSPLWAAGILWDTRIPASDLRKRGHPHPLAGIRDGYPPSISSPICLVRQVQHLVVQPCPRTAWTGRSDDLLDQHVLADSLCSVRV
jgi:hypothetical protein